MRVGKSVNNSLKVSTYSSLRPSIAYSVLESIFFYAWDSIMDTVSISVSNLNSQS